MKKLLTILLLTGGMTFSQTFAQAANPWTLSDMSTDMRKTMETIHSLQQQQRKVAVDQRLNAQEQAKEEMLLQADLLKKQAMLASSLSTSSSLASAYIGTRAASVSQVGIAGSKSSVSTESSKQTRDDSALSKTAAEDIAAHKQLQSVLQANIKADRDRLQHLAQAKAAQQSKP